MANMPKKESQLTLRSLLFYDNYPYRVTNLEFARNMFLSDNEHQGFDARRC